MFAATGELQVAHTIPEAENHLLRMLGGAEDVLAGYQVSPEVPTGQLLVALATIMRAEVDPTFNFDVVDNCVTDSGNNPTPHLDANGWRFEGLAVHESVEGEGRTVLQATRPDGRHIYPPLPEDLIGPRLGGKLYPGVKTIFSEGLRSGDGRVWVGPTYHYFENDEATEARHWRRYTRSFDDQPEEVFL